MKLPSNSNTESVDKKQDKVVSLVNSSLDQSVEQLSASIKSDIAQARVKALSKLKQNKQNKQKSNILNVIKSYLVSPAISVGLPVAAAVVVVISMKYMPVESIPELPLAMMATEIPNEDFAMLAELEFVTWLAENEQNSLL